MVNFGLNGHFNAREPTMKDIDVFSSPGFIKTALAFRALMAHKYSEASTLFEAASKEGDILDFLKECHVDKLKKQEREELTKLIADFHEHEYLSKSNSLGSDKSNKTELELKDVLRKPDPVIQAKSPLGHSFGHHPGELFYEDLLEDDSLINKPVLARLSLNPDLPDVELIYSPDEYYDGTLESFDENNKEVEIDEDIENTDSSEDEDEE